MPSSIDNLQASNIAALQAMFAQLGEVLDKAKKGAEGIPEANSDTAALLSSLELPSLTPPMSSLSLDTLLQAIGDEDRRNTVQVAADKLRSDGESLQAEGQKKLEEIAKKLEELAKSKTLGIFSKIFQVVGVIVGAIAAAATITVGALTGNPLLVAAGVMTAIMTVDSVVSLASDGKYSISAGFTELGKKMGMSDEAAQWFGFGVQMALIVVTVALSFGGAAAANTGNAATTVSEKVGETMSQVITKSSTIANVAGGVNMVGEGGATIAGAVISYNIAMCEKENLDIDAILEQIREAIKRGEEFVEFEMEASQNLLGRVREIVQESVETTTAIVTAGPA